MGNEGEHNAFLVQGRQVLFIDKCVKKGKYSGIKILSCILFSLFFFSGVECYAQSSSIRKKAVENKDSIMPFKSRLAFKTNAVDWLVLLPNVTAEFDLFGSPYKHYTLSLGVKGNWSTSQNYKPSLVYNLFDVRAEVRKYFRTTQRNFHHLDSASFFQRLKEEVFTIKRFHPRYWRAYYWGVYADYANYNFKFGKRGMQGSALGLGVSGGYSIPLYGYRENFVDLELGASIGLVYTKYDAYRYDEESNCYPRLPEKSKGGHIVPFPVVSDLRVAFVYRFSTSVKNKYKLIDYDKINARTEAKRQKQLRRDSISEARTKIKELKKLQKDSLNLAKDSLSQIKDSLKKQEKLMKDSLEQVRKLDKEQTSLMKDSLEQIQKLEKEQAKLMKDSLENVAKEEKKRAKEKKKEKEPEEGVETPEIKQQSPDEQQPVQEKQSTESESSVPQAVDPQSSGSRKYSPEITNAGGEE